MACVFRGEGAKGLASHVQWLFWLYNLCPMVLEWAFVWVKAFRFSV